MHWFSITNSIMIVLFLTIMIAMILLRALRKDIAAYNNSDPQSKWHGYGYGYGMGMSDSVCMCE
ncbi:hypothetical protein EON63_10970 [archaeon]|nr:MAG: hypothetical protein EON63_10970 [archaeon]